MVTNVTMKVEALVDSESVQDIIQSSLSDIEEAHKFLHLENRLNTFKKWIYKDEDPCNKFKLAEAGFIFIGNDRDNDSLKCFVCHKELDGWERTDDPWDEHIKHSPMCEYVQLEKPQADCSIQQLFDLKRALEDKHLLNCLKKVEQHFLKLCELCELPKSNKGKRRNRK